MYNFNPAVPKFLFVFIFNSVQQQCNDLTRKIQGFRLLAALKSVIYVIEMRSFLLLTVEIHANSCSYFLQWTNKKQFTIECSKVVRVIRYCRTPKSNTGLLLIAFTILIHNNSCFTQSLVLYLVKALTKLCRLRMNIKFLAQTLNSQSWLVESRQRF